MGLFRRRSEPAFTLPAVPPAEATITLGACNEVVGESFYSEALEAGLGDNSALDVVAVLLPEPNNPHDRKAIGVYVQGHKVGHLSREDARRFRERVLEGWRSAGVAAVGAIVYRGGSSASVVLEPSYLPAASRPRLCLALSAAGFRTRHGDVDGFTLQERPKTWKVVWSGSDQAGREENVPAMAEALRAAGYDAKMRREDGYPTIVVRAV
ncbi:MAG: HIRAN domain-containing protein [Microthrixaceae bacterium]|nr:HIRAN domain-containing protein [Microthrixaceae bacterium]